MDSIPVDLSTRGRFTDSLRESNNPILPLGGSVAFVQGFVDGRIRSLDLPLTQMRSPAVGVDGDKSILKHGGPAGVVVFPVR
jgi:hypothetical protein